MMKLSVPIHVLKRKAKLIARQQRIPLNRALDLVAQEEGFKSWSLLSALASDAAKKPKSNASQITSLPLDPEDRIEFVAMANTVFESILDRIEANNPKATRKLWDAGYYVDNLLLEDDMLPIDRNYALSLIDAFLVHYVIELALQADNMTS